MSGNECKLCACSLAFAIGMTFGLGVFLLGIIAWLGQYGHEMVSLIGSVYYGYSATFLGSIYGFLWGFVDGFVCGFLIGFFYNLIHKCKCCKRCQ